MRGWTATNGVAIWSLESIMITCLIFLMTLCSCISSARCKQPGRTSHQHHPKNAAREWLNSFQLAGFRACWEETRYGACYGLRGSCLDFHTVIPCGESPTQRRLPSHWKSQSDVTQRSWRNTTTMHSPLSCGGTVQAASVTIIVTTAEPYVSYTIWLRDRQFSSCWRLMITNR